MAKKRVPTRSQLSMEKYYQDDWWDSMTGKERDAYNTVVTSYRLAKQDNGAHPYLLKDELERAGWVFKPEGGTHD